jgi:putative hydrolase of the HAD superfamily
MRPPRRPGREIGLKNVGSEGVRHESGRDGGVRAGLKSGLPGTRRVWFLDLDDTLHDASHAIFGAIDQRMTDFVARLLAVDAAEANRVRLKYWRRYGATMLGLLRHHAVDHRDFLRETHDFDVPALLSAERGVAARMARLPGRKVLLTNAPHDYAQRVVAAIGLRRGLAAIYPIESMRWFGRFRPKPSSSMMRMLLALEGLAGPAQRRRAILVEDNLANLRAARAAGMQTVLVQRGGGAHRRLAGGAYVDVRIASIGQLRRVAGRLGR